MGSGMGFAGLPARWRRNNIRRKWSGATAKAPQAYAARSNAAGGSAGLGRFPRAPQKLFHFPPISCTKPLPSFDIQAVKKSTKLSKIDALQVKAKQAHDLARWERFLESECGCYPASLAAIKLRMTPQGVYQASQRGWLVFFQVGRNRWYGRKSVIFYRDSVSKKFPSCRTQPHDSRKKPFA